MPARNTKSDILFRDQLYGLFACNLKQYRQAAGLKMYVAADLLGVSKSTWSQWEAGKRFPNGEMLAALAKSLNVSPWMLLKNRPT